MEFNSTCRWVTPVPISADKMIWEYLEAGGITAFGAALKELEHQLSRNRMLQSETGVRPPIIVFITDGMPADSWEDNLRKLWENSWYRSAIKIAVAIGDSVDPEILAKLVGSSETIFSISETDLLSNSFDDIYYFIEKYSPIPWEDLRQVDDERDDCVISDDCSILFQPQSPEEVLDNYNRAKCKLLKTIRKAFADANQIPYEITECLEEGRCHGSCLPCNIEVQAMNQLLTNRVMQGEDLVFPSNDTTLLDEYLPSKDVVDQNTIWGEW